MNRVTKILLLVIAALAIGFTIWWAGSKTVNVAYVDGTPVEGILEIIDQAGRPSPGESRAEHSIIDGAATLGWGLSGRGGGNELLYRILVRDIEVQSGHFTLEQFGPSHISVKRNEETKNSEQDVDPNA
jgi:hypothetical protein